ncbi:MAG: hypothetical protein HS132_11145 [Planctomycetia bacterium]|nr:hypothetical protein [Planctomycetia bacterium]
MRKIVLFNSPILFEKNIDIFETTPKFIRLGIASLAGFLRKNGIDVKIIEPYTQSVADIIVGNQKIPPQNYSGLQ